MDALREQLEEESDSKTDLQRHLSRANAEANQWRVKFESEGVSRSEELEEIRRKLSAKLQECESNLESAVSKISGLEKNRSRLQVWFYSISFNKAYVELWTFIIPMIRRQVPLQGNYIFTYLF